MVGFLLGFNKVTTVMKSRSDCFSSVGNLILCNKLVFST